MNKLQYIIRSSAHVFSPKACPYCSCNSSQIKDRKYLVTTLNECSNCHFLFRHPIDTVAFNQEFYQEDYEQNDGITTDLPLDTELEQMTSTNFLGTQKDYADKITILKTLKGKAPLKIIDYGASWGYTSFQFKKANFDTQSYEISVPRARFGKKLGVEILTNENELRGEVDVFFSSHVIEHLPDVRSMFLLAQKLLASDGYFIAYSPNGSTNFKAKHPNGFHRAWGQVHPNLLNPEFYRTVFKDVPYLIGSSALTVDQIGSWNGNDQKTMDTSGDELFVIAKLKKQAF